MYVFMYILIKTYINKDIHMIYLFTYTHTRAGAEGTLAAPAGRHLLWYYTLLYCMRPSATSV